MTKKNITKKKLSLNKKLKLKRRSNRFNRRYVMRGGNIKSEYDKITKKIGADIKDFIYKGEPDIIEKKGILARPYINFAKSFLPNLYDLILNINIKQNAILEFIRTEIIYICTLYLILYIINQRDCNIRNDMNNCILPIFNFHISIESNISKLLGQNSNKTYDDNIKIGIKLIQDFLDNFNRNHNVVQNYILVLIIQKNILNNKPNDISKYGIEFKFDDDIFGEDLSIKLLADNLLLIISQRVSKYGLLLKELINYIKNNYIKTVKIDLELDLTVKRDTLLQKVNNINESNSCKKILCMIKYMDYVIERNNPTEHKTLSSRVSSLFRSSSDVNIRANRRISRTSTSSLSPVAEASSTNSPKNPTRKGSRKLIQIKTIDETISKHDEEREGLMEEEKEKERKGKFNEFARTGDELQRKLTVIENEKLYCSNLSKDCSYLDLEYILNSLKELIYKIFEFKEIQQKEKIKDDISKYIKKQSIQKIIKHIAFLDHEYTLYENYKYTLEGFGFNSTHNYETLKSVIFRDDNGSVYIFSDNNTYEFLSINEIKNNIDSKEKKYLITNDSRIFKYNDTGIIIKFKKEDISRIIEIIIGDNKKNFKIKSINNDGSAQVNNDGSAQVNELELIKSDIGITYILYEEGNYEFSSDNKIRENYKSVILNSKTQDDNKKYIKKYILKDDLTYEVLSPEDIIVDVEATDQYSKAQYFIQNDTLNEQDSSNNAKSNVFYLITKNNKIYRYYFNSRQIIKFEKTDVGKVITYNDGNNEFDCTIKSINDDDGSANISIIPFTSV
jgi:hypothetical protein